MLVAGLNNLEPNVLNYVEYCRLLYQPPSRM